MSYKANFQDWEPVVLSKTKSHKSNNTSTINKSNIHINKPKIEDDNEAHRIIKYTIDQRKLISEARQALGLSQKALAEKIHNSLNQDFIINIENGTTKFDQKTFNTIKRNLNIK